jgi:hypothetical protein
MSCADALMTAIKEALDKAETVEDIRLIHSILGRARELLGMAVAA